MEPADETAGTLLALLWRARACGKLLGQAALLLLGIIVAAGSEAAHSARARRYYRRGWGRGLEVEAPRQAEGGGPAGRPDSDSGGRVATSCWVGKMSGGAETRPLLGSSRVIWPKYITCTNAKADLLLDEPRNRAYLVSGAWASPD